MIVFRMLLASALSTVPALCGELGATNIEPAVAAACRQADISAERVSWLLVDPVRNSVIDSRWPDAERAVPLGSLVKPFAALAYAQGHDFRFPEYECLGAKTNCWLPSGHKRIGIVSALAHSCNSYFRQLTREVLPVQMEALAGRFGLTPPLPDAPSTAYLGLGTEWRITPISLARAYHELLLRSQHPGVGPIIAGLREAARSGTAAHAGTLDTLAKTGTAPCTHTDLRPAGDGDGFVILLGAADRPLPTLLMRVHGVPGMVAAEMAGKVWREFVTGNGTQP
ncbi:MAG: hypothetical protein O2968_06540 [Acidobacteria bacterium]|nr:hypothetical protein [Acidobacteriota bacterium]